MLTRRRQAARGQSERGLRPCAERLEDRLLLYSTLGGNWVYGSRITYSFAPDGTDIGGIPSAWYQRMSDLGISEQAWKDEFRKAAATWATVAQINLVEVPDNGAPFSTPGHQQNDPRFGDIRIAGIPQGTSVLGSSYLPPPYNGGTLAGDIVMNTYFAWTVNSTPDLQTVAMHEFGHALGLGHSTTTTAVQYASYNGVKQSLTTDDINGIRSIYGARQPDRFDAIQNNGHYAYATNLTPYIDGNAQVRMADLDITGYTDADWYHVIVPTTTTGTMTVTMQSSGLSSLSPKLVVYNYNNGSLQGLAMPSAPNSYGATVSHTVPNVTPGQSFYFRAQTADGGPSGTGTYGLLINFGSQPMAPIAPPDTTVPEQPNTGGPPIYYEVGPQPLPSKAVLARAHDMTTGSDDSILRLGNLAGLGETFHVSQSGVRPGPGPGPGRPRTPEPPWVAHDGFGLGDALAVLTGGPSGIISNLTGPPGWLRGRLPDAALRAIDSVLAGWNGAA